MKGISVSSVRLASGATHASHVLVAMEFRRPCHGSVRFSFGRSNSEDDVDYVVDTSFVKSSG
jgi:cysteine desulfurase